MSQGLAKFCGAISRSIRVLCTFLSTVDSQGPLWALQLCGFEGPKCNEKGRRKLQK